MNYNEWAAALSAVISLIALLAMLLMRSDHNRRKGNFLNVFLKPLFAAMMLVCVFSLLSMNSHEEARTKRFAAVVPDSYLCADMPAADDELLPMPEADDELLIDGKRGEYLLHSVENVTPDPDGKITPRPLMPPETGI